MLQLFSGRGTHMHTHSPSGPLGPKEMSVCGLIQPPPQPPMPVLMMASTCCFNVTAGSPSIPHWLWLPSAAGSSPLYPPPSVSSAIWASPPSPFTSILCASYQYYLLPSIFLLFLPLSHLVSLSRTSLQLFPFPVHVFLFSVILSFLSPFIL